MNETRKMKDVYLDSDRTVNKRHNTPERNRFHSERYDRHSALSPLRSPLRPEENRSLCRDYSCRDRRNRCERRPFQEDRNSTSYRSPHDTAENKSRRRCWKRLGTFTYACQSNEKECPQLDKTRENTGGPSSTCYTESRSSEKQSGSRRKWEQVSVHRGGDCNREPKQQCTEIKSSWGDIMDTEEARLSLRKEIAKVKARMLRNEQGRKRMVEKGSSNENRPEIEYEFNEDVLLRRQKQVEYGKNTEGYNNYLQLIPKYKRLRDHPRTPNKFIKYSRRKWDAKIRVWRRLLHVYDPHPEGESKDVEDGSFGAHGNASETCSEVSFEGSSSQIESESNPEASPDCDDITPDSSQADDICLVNNLKQIIITPPSMKGYASATEVGGVAHEDLLEIDTIEEDL